ncbi:MAG: activator of Hsp90 ATPase 1 family protein [Bacteroidetes bacterium]|jgi:uncharacterized protein YndB with AHSA1/START domain|nr:activator of Hsp90 ATPase 1 family protein [Bacteroidota bacterium]
MTLEKTNYVVDKENKTINVTREFNAPVSDVWNAWTTAAVLEKWWAPKPWKAETKTMDFREGGAWAYAMVGPNGEKHWAGFEFVRIDKDKTIEGRDFFTDAQGTKSKELPNMHWVTQFISTDKGTKLEIKLTFESVKDLETIVEMGFKEGFAMAHNNLDEVLAGK